jgi:hypothetical protein
MKLSKEIRLNFMANLESGHKIRFSKKLETEQICFVIMFFNLHLGCVRFESRKCNS